MKPATTPRNENLTVKQRRAAQREEKLAKFRRQQKRSVRNRRIAVISIPVAVLVVVGAIVLSVILIPKPPSYTPGGADAAIKGVAKFNNVSSHVETTVSYPQTPPAGGEHNPVWLNCGVYTRPVSNENAVHSLEHGAIWVTYDPSLSAGELDTLRSKLPSSYAILSPYEGLPAPIVLSGWNVQLKLKSAGDPRIVTFFENYWKGKNAPEPGASCTGGVSG